MFPKNHPIHNYRRFLLNRSTSDKPYTTIVELIENMVVGEDELSNYCFHKITVYWTKEDELLFDTLSEYFSTWFVPVDVTKKRDIMSFYTSNLNLILGMAQSDFMFSYDNGMFNLDVHFYDQTAAELFDNEISIDDIVSSVVSRRFSEKKELDLSNFCNDQEFKDKKICFYKLFLLANFKILMLRIGKDTKSLNLSNNELCRPPLSIMNFFIKGDLTEINLSYNKISKITGRLQVCSKVEKLWLEGNPLCEDYEPSAYVKYVTMKFPRVTELDGIKLNEFGVGFPFFRNYMANPTKYLKMLVEKFLTLYFSHYDTVSRRKNIAGFYDDYCNLSITTGFTDDEKLSILSLYGTIGHNILGNVKAIPFVKGRTQTPKIHLGKYQCLTVLSALPKTQHDPTTFTVDMIMHDKKSMLLVVDGIFKDLDTAVGPDVFRFRRTFLFKIYKLNPNTSVYKIYNEMIYIASPSLEQLENSFKLPIRNTNTLELVNPEQEEIEVLVKILCHLSQLKKEEAEDRLRQNNWDLKKTLTQLVSDMNDEKVPGDVFVEENDFSDSSSHIDDEMVD